MSRSRQTNKDIRSMQFWEGIQSNSQRNEQKNLIKKLLIELLLKKNSSLGREIDIFRKLNHKNCINLQQFIGKAYVSLVIDYVEGGELFEHLNSWEEILGENAMRYNASIRRLIHCDLKPQNILVRNKECLDLLILFYGYSKIITSESDQILAPELILRHHYGGKADVFLSLLYFIHWKLNF